MVVKKTLIIALFSTLFLSSFNKIIDKTSYKCMIQMKNYTGEGAYVVISLLDNQNKYLETLYVQGDDDEWYSDITEWWNFHGKTRTNIDAITGATISGGQRAISVIQIDNNKIDNGYKLRFESAVEDQEYYTDDVLIELTSENLKNKLEGKGFIRYIRMMPQ
ncbi:DUF2271 domain-containing protein [Tenacibaculum sp. C7A-26P2]|uniref:DUF2271 domain-containing protein n=1 Tax=Tenacibaculum sp. C7A-26P2 TaxID=3447504 RepID=UPI003F86C651